MKKIVNINENNFAEVIKPLVEKYLREGIERKRLAEAKVDRIISESINKVLAEDWGKTYRKWRDLSNSAPSLHDPEVEALHNQWSKELYDEFPDFDKRGHAFDMLTKRIDFENGKFGDDDSQYERHNILKKQRELGDEDPMDDLDAVSIRDKEWNGSDEDDDVDDSAFYSDDLAKEFGI